jgi:hypothetical protein
MPKRTIRLPGLPVRSVRAAPATVLLELDPVTAVVTVLFGDVVAPLARRALERHMDAAVGGHCGSPHEWGVGTERL